MAQAITQDMLLKMLADTNSLTKGCNEAASKLDSLDKSFQGVQKGVGFANQALSTFVGMMGTKVVDTVSQAIGFVGGKFQEFTEFAKGATLDAARIEVQWRVLSMTGAKMGVTFDQIKDAVGGLRAAGIKTSEALQTMTQWLSAGLPADKLKELSRSAQDLAVVLGSDSTAAMERFNWFVQTGNSELLRTVGIMQTSTQMEERFAQGIGKTREQLSDQERKLARVNGLLQETATYAGAYEQALSDPFKRMTSLGREVSNVVEAIGAIFVPMLGAVVDVASDALEKLERLFRVTKKEAKETGAVMGTWKEGFLKLRAIVTAFANWFLSIWQRLTKNFDEQAENMMDKFVNAIIKGVKAAADALRKFATFIAGIFGGKAPGEVTTAGMAAVKPEAKAKPKAPAAPPIAEAAQVMAAPEEAAKLRAKPVEAPKAEDLARYADLMNQVTAATQKLSAASATAAAARDKLAGAEARLAAMEEWVEDASKKVEEIRRRVSKLESQWAEIPERFTRGRKRQLQAEIEAAEEEQRKRQEALDQQQKLVNAAQEQVKLAEEYEREVEKTTNALQSQAEKLGESIAQQTEKYNEWLGKLQEAEQVSLVEPVQAVVDEFQSLDDLTAGYLTEIEGELLPAFASIEQSVMAIGDNLGRALEKAKEFVTVDLAAWAVAWWDKLQPIRDFFKWLIEVALPWVGQKIGEAVETYKQVTTIANIAMPGGASGAVALAGEEESLYEKFGSWLSGLADKKQEAEQTADETLAQPFIDAAERARREVVGESILPEMVESILDWTQRLATDVVGPLDEFANYGINTFNKLADAWTLKITSLSENLTKLTTRFELLAKAIAGIPPIPSELQLQANGSLKIVNVDLRGSTFGSGIDERQVKDWMFDAMAGVAGA